MVPVVLDTVWRTTAVQTDVIVIRTESPVELEHGRTSDSAIPGLAHCISERSESYLNRGDVFNTVLV